LLRFRQRNELYRTRAYWSQPGGTDIVWHGIYLCQPDWGEQSHSIAFELTDPILDDGHLLVMLNAYWEPLVFDLPDLPAGYRWAQLVDTAQPSPADFAEPPVFLDENQSTYSATSRSAVVLVKQPISLGDNPS
jgi:glycogen operon protein